MSFTPKETRDADLKNLIDVRLFEVRPFDRSAIEDIERGIGGGDWRDLSYWSPHWHILGLAEDFEADDPDEQDGWVARRIR